MSDAKATSLAKNTIVIGIGTFLSKVISFFIVPLFSRWLSIADYGLFDLCNTMISLIVPIATISCGESLFRFLLDKDNKRGKIETITNAAIIYAAGLFVGICVAIPLCKYLLSLALLPAFVFYLVADTLYNYTAALLRGLKDTKGYALVGVYYILILALISFGLVRIAGLGLKGLVFSYGISFFLSACIGLYRCHLIQYIDFKMTNGLEIRRLLNYSLPNTPNSISWWIMQASDRTVVASILGTSFNGIYAVANYIPAICTTFFNAFHLSWQQDISERINKGNPTPYINKVLNDSSLIIISICNCVLCGSFLAFRFLFSSSYSGAYQHAAILVFAILLSFTSQFFGGILVGMKNTKALGSSTIFAATVNLLIDIVFIRSIGLYAASLSTLACYFVLFLERIYIIRKSFKIRFERQTILLFFIFLYFFFTYYINRPIIRYFNLGLSILIFVWINRHILQNIFNSVTKRISRRN